MSAFDEPSRPLVQIYGNGSESFDLTTSLSPTRVSRERMRYLAALVTPGKYLLGLGLKR